MNIGDKFVVVNRPYFSFLITKFSEYDAKFRILEIIEKREDAKEEWTGNPGTGFLAKDINTNELYGFNYPIINGGYSDTPFVRYISNNDKNSFFDGMTEKEEETFFEVDYMLYDITTIQCPSEATFCKNVDFISYCSEHQRHYNKNNGCSYCEFKIKANENRIPLDDKPKFKGWY